MWAHCKKIDWLIVISVAILLCISLLSIYSTTHNKTNIYFLKQIIFSVIAIILIIGISFLDYRILKNHSFFLVILYLIMLIFLVGLLFFTDEIRGAKSWFNFGKFSFEPIEYTKLVIILILAKYFSLRHIEMYRLRHLIVSGIYLILPILAVLKQPDFGSVIILTAIWLGVIIFIGIKLRHLILLAGSSLCAAIAAWAYLLKDYQKIRIISFINPQLDPLGSGHNIIQSLISIGSGGIIGKGLGFGTQNQLNFLPEAHTDFIFASIAEEWGLIGLIIIFFLFAFIFYRLIKIGLRATDNFSRLFISATVIMLSSQVIINIAINLGLLPITGIPLPFLSYGGSNLIMNSIALGIIQSIKIKKGIDIKK